MTGKKELSVTLATRHSMHTYTTVKFIIMKDMEQATKHNTFVHHTMHTIQGIHTSTDMFTYSTGVRITE